MKRSIRRFSGTCLHELIVLAAVLCITPDCHAKPIRPLEFTVSFEAAAAHYVKVRMVVPSQSADVVHLMMPTWTPGSYLIREYARHVDQIHAVDGLGEPLPIEKTSKNRWMVMNKAGTDISITYRLYCREMSVRTNWVDHDMAILNGAATFLTLDDAREHPHQVRFELPARWARTITALPAVEGTPHTYLASSLDELIDSPVLCGNPVTEEFSAGGAVHVVANAGDSRLWDTAKAAADVRKIVEQQQSFWGIVPYQGYKFLNVISESSGGLEHDNSTLVMTSRWNFRNEEKYDDWLSLMSHEFFHTWNVRRLRPASLATYDFEAENNTRSLWIAEGITSYYEDLMLVRAGLIDHKAYLKRLSANIEKLQTSPGRNVQSLAESSFDTWIKFYRPDENSSNSRISYYVKGCVVAFLLDARIRELTADQKSLDDVMRLMYARYANEKGYTDEDFENTVTEVAGTDMSTWLVQHVETAAELDYQPALDWFGLEFPTESADSKEPADAAEPADASNATGRDTLDATSEEKGAAQQDSASQQSTQDADSESRDEPKKPKAWLGINTSNGDGRLTIVSITHDSPAHAAGLNVGDELLAFNEYRASTSTWQDQLTQLGIGQPIQILVARRGEIRTIEVTTAPEPREKWSLKQILKPSDDITARLANWLG